MKRTIAALFIVLAGFFIFVGVPQAQARPLTNTSCSNGCSRTIQWSNFQSHGMSTNVTVEDPNGSDVVHYDEYISLSWPNGSFVTMDQTVKDTTYCGTAAYYEWSIYDALTNHSETHCYRVPTGDFNTNTTLSIAYASNQLEFFIWDSTHTNQCEPCIYADQNFSGLTNFAAMFVSFVDSGFTGHKVWGGDWNSNQYYETSGWHYDTGNGVLAGGIPPQMFWYVTPSTSSTGGDLYSCVYDSTLNVCFPGS